MHIIIWWKHTRMRAYNEMIYTSRTSHVFNRKISNRKEWFQSWRKWQTTHIFPRPWFNVNFHGDRVVQHTPELYIFKENTVDQCKDTLGCLIGIHNPGDTSDENYCQFWKVRSLQHGFNLLSDMERTYANYAYENNFYIYTVFHNVAAWRQSQPSICIKKWNWHLY